MKTTQEIFNIAKAKRGPFAAIMAIIGLNFFTFENFQNSCRYHLSIKDPIKTFTGKKCPNAHYIYKHLGIKNPYQKQGEKT